MTWLLEQLEASDFAENHTIYIDEFPDFTRQHMAILEHFICHSPLVVVGMNCDSIDSDKLAFEKAADTACVIYDNVVEVATDAYEVFDSCIIDNINISGGLSIGFGGKIKAGFAEFQSACGMDIIGFQFADGKLRFGHFGESGTFLSILGFSIGKSYETYEPFGNTNIREEKEAETDFSYGLGDTLMFAIGGHYEVSFSISGCVKSVYKYVQKIFD